MLSQNCANNDQNLTLKLCHVPYEDLDITENLIGMIAIVCQGIEVGHGNPRHLSHVDLQQNPVLLTHVDRHVHNLSEELFIGSPSEINKDYKTFGQLQERLLTS